MHVIGVAFGSVLRSEINGEFFWLRIQFDVQKPLRRGIFVSIENKSKSWIPFKYEKLPTFCFDCGKMGHGLKKCLKLTPFQRKMLEKYSGSPWHAYHTTISWFGDMKLRENFWSAAPINYCKFLMKILELTLYNKPSTRNSKKTMAPKSTNKNQDYNMEVFMELSAYEGKYAVQEVS